MRTSSGQAKEVWYYPPSGAVNDGQWHHWVFFLDATNIGYWMDGELVFSEPHGLTSGDFSATTPFYLLRETNEPNRWLGDVDEFAVYRGVLSEAEEILDHYNNGAGKYYAASGDTIAQAASSSYKTVSYSPPATSLQDAAQLPQQQTTTIASFTYDGDGRQVKAVVGSTTTYYIGRHYQIENGVVTKYYFGGAQRVAMRKNGTLYYLLGDHLGSTSITTNTSGGLVAELRYKACPLRCASGVLREGETRYSSGATPTTYQFTGQRIESSIGLYFYNARWYDGVIGRFIQADTIIPGGVQGLDRYAYTRNNPVRYTDPSGHDVCDEDGNCYDQKKGWSLKSGALKWNYTKIIRYGYSSWEAQTLSTLYDKGGPKAQHGVRYILENDIHIKVGHLLFNLDKDRGAWFSERAKTITLNANSYSNQTLPDAWGLSLIIHEAKHLEQGTELSHSKLGEMEGWQVQFEVLSHFQPLSSEQQKVLNAQSVDKFVDVLKTSKSENWRDYWFNGIWGLHSYPDYPDWIWYDGSMYYGKPWWLRINPP